jgi:hypothetical protein
MPILGALPPRGGPVQDPVPPEGFGVRSPSLLSSRYGSRRSLSLKLSDTRAWEPHEPSLEPRLEEGLVCGVWGFARSILLPRLSLGH